MNNGTFGFGGASSNSHATQEMDESTPWIAAADGDLNLLQQCLQIRNIPPSACVDSNGLTLLHSAASYGQMNVMQWLLTNNGANVNAKDSDGDTPLHHCDDVLPARMLIESAGASPFITNNTGETALQMKQKELVEEDDDDIDNYDYQNLKKLVEYLQSLPTKAPSS